jgi:uncharacterized membrane protein
MANEVEDSITVEANVDKVYQLWYDFENFPKFLKHIHSVERKGKRSSHWKIKVPLGKSVEWDAETTEVKENKKIAWKTVEGDIQMDGEVDFEPVNEQKTNVRLKLTYDFKTGLAGSILRELFASPEKELSKGLEKFKEIAEE